MPSHQRKQGDEDWQRREEQASNRYLDRICANAARTEIVLSDCGQEWMRSDVERIRQKQPWPTLFKQAVSQRYRRYRLANEQKRLGQRLMKLARQMTKGVQPDKVVLHCQTTNIGWTAGELGRILRRVVNVQDLPLRVRIALEQEHEARREVENKRFRFKYLDKRDSTRGFSAAG